MTIEHLPNGRDLGGRRTRLGTMVRRGVVFRSAAPANPGAGAALVTLDVRTVIDLRTSTERDSTPETLPDSVEHVVADMLADTPDSGAASLASLAAAAMSGGTEDVDAGDVRAMMLESYRAFVMLPSARRATVDTLRRLAAAEPGNAVLFHCTAGKDRTGWMTALVLTLLDVDPDDVMADYLASGPIMAAMLEPLRERMAARGLDLDALAPAVTVEPEYLRTAFDAATQEYGSLAGFVAQGLGLGAGFREELAAALLE